MATDSIKKTETTDTETEAEQTPEPALAKTADEPGTSDSKAADSAADNDGADASDEADDSIVYLPADNAAPTGGFVAGAGAVVSAGLALCSISGTSVGEMLHSRKELIGQIESSTGGGGDQINAFYSAPWHTAAFLNGIFAFLAVVIGGVLLAVVAQRADTRSWVKAVALGGVILGAIGLLIAFGMYFDLFANAPELPKTPS